MGRGFRAVVASTYDSLEYGRLSRMRAIAASLTRLLSAVLDTASSYRYSVSGTCLGLAANSMMGTLNTQSVAGSIHFPSISRSSRLGPGVDIVINEHSQHDARRSADLKLDDGDEL